jgi:EF-hand domain pair
MSRTNLIYTLALLLQGFNTATPAMANLSPSSWESGITLAVSKRSVLQNLSDTKRLSWDRQLTEVFYEADFNRDGYVTFDECYERLLRFYIKLNQQAPIPPPDRNTVLQLYKNADLNHNQRLSLSEFKQLAQALIGRAYTRLLVHKLVTVLIGPYLATTFVHFVATAPTLAPLRKEASILISEHLRLPSSLSSVLQSTHFWRTIFLIFTVSQLGNIVLNFVNYLLYANNDKATKSHKRKASPISV